MATENESRLRSRENAIETLIDMHPRGAAYRAARIMNEAQSTALQSRYNRLPDWALLDSANSLSKYEILPDSPEVLSDLQKTTSDEQKQLQRDGEKPLKDGWQNRTLRHHEKIVRAKNSSAPQQPSPSQGVKPASTKTVPPPRLISALRQIFESPSSSDLKGLAIGEGSSSSKGKSDNQQVNVLPSLLHSVVNHSAFSDSSSFNDALSASVKRHLASLFDSPRKGFEGDNEKDDKVEEVGPPGAGNLEALIGNVCRDLVSERGINTNSSSSINGLLIAALSIMTSSLSDEDMDFSCTNQTVTTAEGGKTNDCSADTLQVGGLLALLRPSNKTEVEKFLIDHSLSRYFAEAASVYEERVEIQKALLHGSGKKGMKEDKSESLMGTPPPPLENLVSLDDGERTTDRNNEVIDLADADEAGPGSDDGLPSGEDGLTSEDVANVTRMLLSNIADIVGGNALNFEGEEDDADDIEFVDSEEEEDSDDDDGEESENSEATREYQEMGANADVSDRSNEAGDHENEEGEDANNGEGNGDTNDEEETMLQRALALSLAATVSAGGSDRSNSDGSESEGKQKAVAPSIRPKNIKSGELKRKSSGGSVQSISTQGGDEKDDSLPPLPTPPSIDVLPRSCQKEESSKGDSAVFDPASLSSFGNVPASNVLVHLLQTLLKRMESGIDVATGNSQKESSIGSMAKLSLLAKTPLTSSMKKSSSVLSEDSFLTSSGKPEKEKFAPDSVTAQLLVASLHLSSHLRGQAIGAMTDILSDEEGKEVQLAEEEGKEETIKIADSVDSEDPLFDKEEDPLQVSLETKGMKRKAAAAADITALRHTTKQNMVEVWTERASFYSACCYITMRCLRILMAKCIQQGIRFSDDAGSESENIIYMSTKSRIGFSTIVSSFHSLSVPSTIQSLQESLDAFCAGGTLESKQLLDELQVSSLCIESLSLWGISIPFTCPEHNTRLDLLRDLVQNELALSPDECSNLLDLQYKIKSGSWDAIDLQSLKLEVLCGRLRMSDMLDCFVARPKVRGDDTTNAESDRSLLTASMSTISLLGTLIESSSASYLSSEKEQLPKVAQFYFALCSKTMSILILWNDLMLSPNNEGIEDSSLMMNLNPKFHFDASKCADSIAIDPPGATANQRAAKVWGTVLSSACFHPKTGIHRFAVKLDKCERGHVFVGVATARASTKTYVGGDKNGWGCIGTQALWHDRNKLRGDYGSMVRTGAVIVATLDTDLGTLSFGLWKDALPDSEGNPGPMSPSMASLSSPRRSSGMSSAGGAMIEDWGIAFEGLPLDVKLYPAVGLYQRDDRATLYSISSSGSSSSGKSSIPPILSSGHVYFPSIQELNPGNVAEVRSWNQLLCSSGISFAVEILAKSINLLSSGTDAKASILLSAILPRLASAICLIPSCIPNLSAKYAMELLPLVTRCAKLIDKLILSENRRSSFNVELKEGKWLIHADLSSSTEPDSKGCAEFEEYVIDLKQKAVQENNVDVYFHGKGASSGGRLSCGHVSLIGAVCGTHLQFIEEWSDEDLDDKDAVFDGRLKSTSSCWIDARLSLDGDKFEGVYSNVQQGTTGKISGFLQTPAQGMHHQSNQQNNLIRTESILCNAAGHLSQVLCLPTVMSDVDKVWDLTNDEAGKLRKAQCTFQDLLESSSILSSGKLSDRGCIRSSVDSVWDRCRALDGGSDIVQQWQDLVYFDLFNASDAPPTDMTSQRRRIESILEAHNSSLGKGSFSRLSPVQYTKTQKKVASVMLYHCGSKSDAANHVCETSRQIMENGIRDALGRAQSGSMSRADICQQHCLLLDSISEFLFDFPCGSSKQPMADVTDEFVHLFKAIQTNDDLDSLKQFLISRTEKTIMRYVGIRSMQLLLTSDDSYEGIQVCPAVESVIVSLHWLCSSSHGQLLPSAIAGCSSSVQNCIRTSVQSMYDKAESVLSAISGIKDIVSLSSLVLALSTCLGSNPSNTMLEKCRDVISACRDLAIEERDQSSMEITFIHTLRTHTAQKILLTSTATLQNLAVMLSQEIQPKRSLDVTDVLLLLIEEMKQTVPIVEESFKSAIHIKETSALGSDWEVSQGQPDVPAPNKKSGPALGIGAFAQTSSLLSSKSAVSSSHGYLGHLLDLLHYFVHTKAFSSSIQVSACDLSSQLIAAVKSSLPLSSRLRVLRILRPVLCTMEANPDVVDQLFEFAGSFSNHLINECTSCNSVTPRSNDDVEISSGAVSVLRSLYSSHSWRRVIHEVIITSYSFTSVCGVLSFLGGLPGCLTPGSFLIIEPDIASSLSSSSSAFTKARGALSGATTSSISSSAGKGVEGIISGLCRQTGLAGVLCSSDSKSGMCEVIVMSNRLISQDKLRASTPKVTVRAVRVSSAEIASAAELPLCINKDMPTNMMGLLLEQLKLSSSVIQGDLHSNKSTSSENLPSVKSLFASAMSMRSFAVLLSEPNICGESKYLQPFLALALQWACQQQSMATKDRLSALPGIEARIWHLLSLRSMLNTKQSRLNALPETILKDLFTRHVSDKKSKSPAAPSAGLAGYRTPPPSLASSFFGLASERISRASTATTENRGNLTRDDDDEESQGASHLREAAIVQMAELGLPRQWAELALRRTGDIEAAVHFCLERGVDMERLIAEEERTRGSSTSSSRRRGLGVNTRMNQSHLISQLVDMGFPRHWCVSALTATSNNVDEALTWILQNGDRLSAEAEDENEKEEDDSEDEEPDNLEQDDSDEGSGGADKTDEATADQNETAKVSDDSIATPPIGWSGSICPIRFISGRSKINTQTLEISGLKDGGFSSVGTKGVLLTSGKWYYEAEVLTAGCLQIGWADGSFAGHCQAERGDGCGDGPSSWAFDGWRRYRWHSNATEWGCRWSQGDVVGCLVDMDAMSISFTLNGKGEEIGMGVAFSGDGFRPCSGVYCCVSFNSREKLRLILGGEGTEPLKFKPEGYRGVGEAILDAIKERETLLREEDSVSAEHGITTNEKPSYLCDFSDGEHGHELFSWQHRYYGSDASVHLGGTRTLRGVSLKKPSKGSAESSKHTSPVLADIAVRLSKIFDQKSKRKSKSDGYEQQSVKSNVAVLKDAYTSILSDVDDELKTACLSLNSLYAQKLVVQTVVAYSSKFSVDLFLPESVKSKHEADVCRNLFNVIDRTASISSWLGDAGSMAVAAEALGLGISTYDNNVSDTPPTGMLAITSDHVIVSGGISQFLSSAVLPEKKKTSKEEGISTPWTFAAASEAAVGSDSGGALSFMRHGLQNAVVASKTFRQTLLAGDDDTDLISPERKRGADSENSSSEYSPDPRLVSFMTGVLLSEPVKRQLSESENNYIMCSLFEAWCIGLLAPSSPWRMICAMTAGGILNLCPAALLHATSRVPAIAKYLGRLESTTFRRVWAERAAMPVCSKYSQALIELLCSVKRAMRLCKKDQRSFVPNEIRSDAATPFPFIPSSKTHEGSPWEWEEGWISSNECWEVWTGTLEIMEVDWKAPQRSIVRTLMDGGEGPPYLGEGCVVMRGLDWGNRRDAGNEDGKDLYEKDKLAKEMELLAEEEATKGECDEAKVEHDADPNPAMDDDPAEKTTEDPADSTNELKPEDDDEVGNSKKVDKKKKVPKSKLPVGTVLSVEPWRGIPGMARRVRWHLTGEEGVYRYGGDGGRFDIAHVEVNEKETRIKKRHPLPESLEQIASRYGFGQRRTCNIILRLNHPALVSGMSKSESGCEGILEMPDFGAGIHVECKTLSDGSISITEKKLLYGSKDSGWEARFGDPSYTPGTVTVISPIHDPDSSVTYEVLLGRNNVIAKNLRNREQDGARLSVTSEMRLYRSKKGKWDTAHKIMNKEYAALYSSPSQPQQICFDSDYHAGSMALSKDKRTVTCSTSEGRGTAFANVGFTSGVHYWEVKIEKAEIGSVFIGVAEKPGSPSGSSQGSSFGFESKPRLNRWLGWGFVNFRATYTAGAERVYGSHCHNGDTVGVMLDCDSGRISYFFDGVKYGEHILNDLGCAFENVSPFGFNADGCGSGGAGQGAPSGVDGVRSSRYPSNGAVRPRALWPVIGLRHPGDRVTMSSKWTTSHGVHGLNVMQNVLSVDEIFCAYNDEAPSAVTSPNKSLTDVVFPQWFVKESFVEYKKWQSGRWIRSSTRGSGPYRLSSTGLDIDLDTTPLVCAAACASIGLPIALLPGDRIDVKRSAGRLLELQEEAVVLGAHQGRLWYRLVSQKSEGGSLMEGGGRAWFWDESEAVEGGLQLIGEGKGRAVELPMISRFKPTCGLKIVYVSGAVVRSDLEIFDGSANIGTIPHGTIIPESNVIERRLNSCGVVRYLIKHESIQGWISSRIRGGKEEPIVEILPRTNDEGEAVPFSHQHTTPEDSALQWYKGYISAVARDGGSISKRNKFVESFHVKNVDEFCDLLNAGHISGMNQLESDSFISRTYGKISDVLPHSDEVDCPFIDCAIVLAGAAGKHTTETDELRHSVDAIAHEVASESLMHLSSDGIPPVKALLARISMLRALNRRCRFALPWLSFRPAQEGSAVFGGLSGFGSSLERAGRTWDIKSKSMWIQAPSTSSRLRACKNLLFPSIKKSLLDSVMDTTATPTPLSHDEYELPREVRTVRINRLKARQAMNSDDISLKRKHSVFVQLQREMRGWSGATLRRGFVAKGHGGQKRAFKVKLVGEGVNDYSGPYREVFTDAMLEVIDVDPEGQSSLGVLEPTANNESDLGDGRDLFMFAQVSGSSSNSNVNNYAYSDGLSHEEKEMLDSFSTLTRSTSEHSREVEDAIVFLGKLAGTACRHGIPVDLPLPLGVVWDRLAEEHFNGMASLKEIDLLAYRRTKEEEYHELAVSSANSTLSTQRRLLNSFAEGMSSVLPVELLTLFTGEQLRDILCGNPDVDVELLRRVVEYEGYTEADDVISNLWDVLREMTTPERKLFLQFVWARNRLPLKEADFDAPFRILKDTKGVKDGEDYPLPSASTCFFSLMLPEYPNKEMLKQKLLFAIENVTTMESDYVTNDVEVSEGWHGL